MIAALLGLCGVFVGAVLTQLLTVSAEKRGRNLEAMVDVAVASGRVIGAHERLYDILYLGGEIPSLESDRAVVALNERSEAHRDWRSARAKLEILTAGDARLYDAMQKFEDSRGQATTWVEPYIQQGTSYDSSKYAHIEEESWIGMREARHDLMDVSRVQSGLNLHRRFSTGMRR